MYSLSVEAFTDLRAQKRGMPSRMACADAPDPFGGHAGAVPVVEDGDDVFLEPPVDGACRDRRLGDGSTSSCGAPLMAAFIAPSGPRAPATPRRGPASATGRTPGPAVGRRAGRSLRGTRCVRRTPGRARALKIRCSCRLPASSDGCARPAKMICTGRRRAVRIAASRCGIVEEQVGADVGGHPPGEPDRQRGRIQQRALRDEARAAGLLARPAPARALTREIDQVSAQPLPRVPQVFVGHGRQPRPPRVLVLVIAPVGDRHRARSARRDRARSIQARARPGRGRRADRSWRRLPMPTSESACVALALSTARRRSASGLSSGTNAALSSRSSGLLAGTSVSSRYSVARPARTCQTCTCTSPQGSCAENASAGRRGASAGVIGASDQSRYS